MTLQTKFLRPRHESAASSALCRKLLSLSPQPQAKVQQIFLHLPKPPYLGSLGDRYLSYSSLIPKHLSLRLSGQICPKRKYSAKSGDFLRFYAYLCHVIDDFACLDLQH